MKQLINNTYVFEMPTNVGLYIQGQEAILIDSGANEKDAKRIYEELQENNLQLNTILCTHYHADHVGGCQYLQMKTNCKVYLSSLNYHLSQYPPMQTSLFYGGFPLLQTEGSYLKPQPFISQELSHDVMPKDFEVVSLPGHTMDMIAIKTPDNVWFIGDALFSNVFWNFFGSMFLYDLEAFKQSAKKVGTLGGEYYIPSHGRTIEKGQLEELVQLNLKEAKRVEDDILSLLDDKTTFDDILAKLSVKYKRKLTEEQYIIVGCTIRSYLSSMEKQGLITSSIENNYLIWRKKENEK